MRRSRRKEFGGTDGFPRIRRRSEFSPPDAVTSAETPDAVEPADDHAADPAASATTLLSNLIDEDLFLQSDEEDLEKQRKRPWRV